MAADNRAADPVERLLQAGLDHYALDRVEEARRCWKQALELKPDDPRPVEFLTAVEPSNGGDTSKDLLFVVSSATAGGLGAGRPDRPARPGVDTARLSRLLKERSYEEALALLYAAREDNPDDASVSRGIQLLKDRLILRYARQLGSLDQVPGRVVSDDSLATLSPESREVLRLVDGISSYGDVAQACSLGRFAAYRALAHAVAKGLIVSTPDAPAPVPPAGRTSSVPPPPKATLRPTASAPPAAVAATLDAASYDDLFERATRAYVRRDVDEALLLFEGCLKRRPDDRRVRHNIEKLKQRKGSP